MPVLSKRVVNIPSYNRLLHWLAIATCFATFPLIFMGGLVTSHGAGMSVPDWPNSYGYNMFLFPPSKWVGGIFYEHTHRLMATVVGMLSIALTTTAWWSEIKFALKWIVAVVFRLPRPAKPNSSIPKRTKWLAIAVLGAVIFQGILGGLRVVLVKLDLAIVHACFAQAFFCLTALVAVVTSRRWMENAPLRSDAKRSPVFALACVALVCIYSQLVVGATMRHFDAGLAIPDVPLAYGKVLPPINATELHAANQIRAWKLGMSPVTMTQVWLNAGHRLGAILVTISVLTLCMYVLTRVRELRGHAAGLLAMLVLQIGLGVSVIIWRKPADVTSVHVAVGALCLVTTFVIAVRSWRMESEPQGARRTRNVGVKHDASVPSGISVVN